MMFEKLTDHYLIRALNAINHAFSSATPVDDTKVCHVLFQLCMIKLIEGNSCQVINLVYTIFLQCCIAHWVCAIER